MGLENLVRSVRNYKGKNKPYFDLVADPIAFVAGANAAVLYYGNKALSYVNDNTDENRGLAMMGAYAALGVALYGLNKLGVIPIAKKLGKRQFNKINRRQKANALSWVKTASIALAFPILYHTSDFKGTLRDFNYDGRRVVHAFERDKEVAYYEVPKTLQSLVPRNLDPDLVKNSDKNSAEGRFYRTLRWDSIITDTEEKYDMPPGLMAGLAMRESSGDPLQLNRGGDGGVGLWQFQPGTAKHYRLRIYGNSDAMGRDRRHGRDMRELFIESGWDYDTIARLDERVDVRKSTEAAGKFLSDLHRQHSDWNKALSAYNRGKPARHPERTEHVRKSRQYGNYYIEHRGEFVN